MTRVELIRNIAKYSGVPGSEAKIFFEIFLKRLSAILKTGQALSLKGFGYFYLLHGKMKKAKLTYEDEFEKSEIIELIFYSEFKVPNNKTFNGLFFNVPISGEDEFNAVDAAFSLSFGKPLIPFKGDVDSDFYIPHTGSELRRLIESKVDKTVENSEITEAADFLELVIDIEGDLFNLSEAHTDEEVSDISFEELISDKDISRQIEEDAILDLADTDVGDEKGKRTSIDWDFDSFDLAVTKEDERHPEPEHVSEPEEEPKVQIDYHKIEMKPVPQEETDTAKPEPVEKFERVKTLSTIMDNKTDEKPETVSSQVKPTEKEKSELPEPVKPKTEKSDIEFIELDPVERTVDYRKERAKRKKSAKLSDLEKSSDKILLNEQKEIFRNMQSSSNVLPFIMLFVSIAIIGYGVYYYLNNIKGAGDKPVTTPIVQLNTDRMNVVQRDFDFPVSYPYPMRTENIENVQSIFDIKKEETEITESVPEVSAAITKPEEPVVIPEEPKLIVNNQPPPGTEKRIDVNLFQYGNVYIVQVAAFRSNSVAENEAGRFRNKGHNAFVERAEVDGSIWHRVKVGNFIDLEEAKRFAVQFK